MSVIQRHEDQFGRIVTRLRRLSPRQLDVVQAVLDIFEHQNAENVVLFQPKTEEQLLARIDQSLSQIDAGLYEDADNVVAELLAEIDE